MASSDASSISSSTERSVLPDDFMEQCIKMCQYTTPTTTTSRATTNDSFITYLYTYVNEMMAECSNFASSVGTEISKSSLYNSVVLKDQEMDEMLNVISTEQERVVQDGAETKETS
eukprot:CAMPEP_0198125342 /NCGR_PEP_ID=MMETSP1442-20131203/42375_1 /TAXON_ID= /ORGANISM="Craspedostauros australis, Strain CCMP3328" /LENGTH=115 /DNA_ID=CAMNT_0043784927 /DNA_START=84 /DNA_END=431 /DNA_ORIENTATION=-